MGGVHGSPAPVAQGEGSSALGLGMGMAESPMALLHPSPGGPHAHAQANLWDSPALAANVAAAASQLGAGGAELSDCFLNLSGERDTVGGISDFWDAGDTGHGAADVGGEDGLA